MATKAIIGFMNPDGTVKAIMVWSDGYPDYTGECLAKHYGTPELASRLIDGGNLRVIEDTLEACSYCKDNNENWEQCKPHTYRNFGHFLNHSTEAQYLYIFQNGKWHYKD